MLHDNVDDYIDSMFQWNYRSEVEHWISIAFSIQAIYLLIAGFMGIVITYNIIFALNNK